VVIVDLRLLTVIRELLLLSRSHDARWSVQGLGMMRYYFQHEELMPGMRLHLWHESLRIPNVSTIHTHPWNFTSHVICGHIMNWKYTKVPESPGKIPDLSAPGYIGLGAYMCQRLKCGTGGGVEGDPVPIVLHRYGSGTGILPGQHYSQASHETHETEATDGTITLVTRSMPVGESPDHAEVFWPSGSCWVSAGPRTAKTFEVVRVVDAALILLESEMDRLGGRDEAARSLREVFGR
jgi:hypothetical protein